jgi:hypothetical protein
VILHQNQNNFQKVVFFLLRVWNCWLIKLIKIKSHRAIRALHSSLHNQVGFLVLSHLLLGDEDLDVLFEDVRDLLEEVIDP